MTSELRRLRRQVDRSVRDARESILELRRYHHGDAAARRLAGAARRRHRDAARCPPDGGRRGTPPGQRVAGCGPAIVPHRAGAVTNAVRHGRPTRIDISVSYDDRQVALTIADDGCGFDAHAQTSACLTTSTSAWSPCASAPSTWAAGCASRACRAPGPRCTPWRG